ncbi:GDP-mannose 4,6-dehydratase [Patulibacter sp. SYSU D01012]|uniref:GDP-mannose 4,6-dehydratase n=1 Tax=Patulibacter sp. SYSU D01012 TaxID=2817381 RepID=UPI001B318110|nr:GDP-mannose 4,6-dehydratase [Patulibacter sp. SYSU D01012]
MSDRVLITGGAGFIGSHLSDALLQAGHHVHVIDDLSTGAIENIRHLKDHPRFGYTIDSCANRAVVAELVDEVDVVYHLAAAVGVELIVESPVRTIETNVHCTEVVLSQAAKKRKPVLLASTSEVYGKSAALPFREDGDLVMGATTKGRWSYACSKAIDEFLALAYWNERKLPTVVVRLFNTVGPRQTGQYGMVVPKFVRGALAERDLQVFGDGAQSRCFGHVADVVRAMAALMADDRHSGEVFNVGTTEEVTIRELADRVVAATGSSSGIVSVPYETAYGTGFEDMHRRVPDTTKIREAIGWAPERDLDRILADVVAYEKTKLPL